MQVPDERWVETWWGHCCFAGHLILDHLHKIAFHAVNLLRQSPTKPKGQGSPHSAPKAHNIWQLRLILACAVCAFECLRRFLSCTLLWFKEQHLSTLSSAHHISYFTMTSCEQAAIPRIRMIEYSGCNQGHLTVPPLYGLCSVLHIRSSPSVKLRRLNKNK